MKLKSIICATLVLSGAFLLAASARTKDKDEGPKPAASSQPAQHQQDLRIEGERRFHANCSRCHTAPPKFPPRMMGTIVRHMRVRAMLTEDDMRLILRYMTE